VAAVLLLTLAASPCLLYGDELGLTDQPVPLDRQRDYFARASGGISRDPTRTPMPWDDGPNFGFSPAPQDKLWLPVACNGADVNVEAQLRDPGSFLNLYRELLRVRTHSPALRHGSVDFIDDSSARDVLAYERRRDDDHKVVALNLSGRSVGVDIGVVGTVLLSTTAGTGVSAGPGLELGPHQAVVIDARGHTP
jgi:alpha-glucosidase